MKKILIITAIILAVLAGGGYYFYKQMIPEMIAKAIVKGEYSPFMPKKLQRKIESIREEANNKISDVIQMADNNGITIDQLIAGLNQVDKKEVITTYNKVIGQQATDPEKVFNIAYENIKIEAFDPMLLKPAFLKNVQKGQIIHILASIKNNNLMDNLEMSIVRSVGKQILLEKKEEIEKRTDLIKY